MTSVVQRINKENLKNDKGGLVKPPPWLAESVQYETIMGSMAYGVSSDSSDMDIYGFCLPKKDMIFPHLAGHIPGFGRQIKRFDQWQQHHIQDPSAGKHYDVTIYSIVRYFQLCMENNPNMIDSMFTPQNCIVSITPIGNMVRENKKMFLHKGSWHTFKGYAFSQLHKARIKVEGVQEIRCFEEDNDISHETTISDLEAEIKKRGGEKLRHLSDEKLNAYSGLFKRSKRFENRKIYNCDTKFLYHVVRLIGEVEQILTTHDIDMQQDKERLKAIRRGELSLEEVEDYFDLKQKELEVIYNNSKLPHSPDEKRIKQLLIDCIEHHYGSIDDAVVNVDRAVEALREINEVIVKNQKLL